MKPVTIIVADDHPIIRDMIKLQIQSETDWQLLGEAGDGPKLLEMAKELVPDVVIVDLVMPFMNGDVAIREINGWDLGIKTIVLSGFFHEANLRRAFDAGASGVVSKTAATAELVEAIETVVGGETYISPDLKSRMSKEKTGTGTKALTKREIEILTLIAEGKSRKQISEIQFISPWTVDKHRSNIKAKLGFSNVAEMVRYAIRNGYVSETFESKVAP